MVIFGNDASRWQGDVDWTRVDTAMQFGFEKISEGTFYKSADWARERPEMAGRAAASGFVPGGYHFLAQARGGPQAEYFAKAAGDMAGFGIAVDVEPRKDPKTGKVISAPTEKQARDCVAELRKLFPGHPIGGYIPGWYWGSRPTTFVDWLWASHYVTGGPASPQSLYAKVPASWWASYGGQSVDLLQFTDKAVVPGVSGPCDCNAFRGSRDKLAALLLPGKPKPPPVKETKPMALKRVWIPSPNKTSPRRGAVRLIVLHTTEGAQSYQSLGSFFGNPASQVSSHVGIDDTPGTVGEYVKRGDAAWTASAANHAAVQAEFCTPSGAADGWSRATWMTKHHQMLVNAAAWIAEESRALGIPLVSLTPAQAQGGSAGVCQHSDLGAWGGGHHDAGPGFPIDYVMSLARGGGTAAPPKPPAEQADEELAMSMQLQFFTPPSGAPYATVVLPNYHSDGKSRARFGCGVPTKLRVDLMGKGDTQTVEIGGDKGAQGFAVPKGCTIFTVRRDTGDDLVSLTFSR